MKESTALRLTILLAALVFAATILGIAFNDIYQDGEWIKAQYLGQDMVTLLVIIPLLLISAHHGINNNVSAWRMVFIAVLLYLSYVYAIFVFVAEFSPLYFLHLPIFSLSLFIMLSLCGCFFISRRKMIMSSSSIRYLVSTYLFLISIMLAAIWISDLLGHAFDKTYVSDTPTGEPLLIVYSLDLGIIIPLMIVGAVGLLRQKTRGIAWAGIMLVKSTLLGFALMAMSISLAYFGFEADVFLIGLWSVLGIIGLVFSIFFMNKLQDALPEGKEE